MRRSKPGDAALEFGSRGRAISIVSKMLKRQMFGRARLDSEPPSLLAPRDRRARGPYPQERSDAYTQAAAAAWCQTKAVGVVCHNREAQGCGSSGRGDTCRAGRRGGGVPAWEWGAHG